MSRVLYVLHSHPGQRPGGAEIYADELFRAVREAGEFEPTLVARVGPPQSTDYAHQGSRFGLVAGDPTQYYFHTRPEEFDSVLGAAHDKRLYQDWRAFLEAIEPDVIHFQHTLGLGYDVVRETRNTLPHAPIVYTLHEFLAICQHGGQMVKTKANQLCYGASPHACHECFPAIGVQTFFLRQRFIASAFELVDMFIAPSEHLRQRFIEWGVPADRIRTENYGRLPVAPLPAPPDAGRRKRIGYFGQIGRFKGVDVLLEAMKLLAHGGAGVQLQLCGAGLERNPPEFQERITALLQETAGTVSFIGHYEQAEVAALMAAVDWVIVPSIWWETGPLVIQEAIMHRRPVICSDIGAMVERIADGVNGLHFRVGDPNSLAETIRRATSDPGLWEELRSRLTDPHPMDQHLATITAIYQELLERRGAHVTAR